MTFCRYFSLYLEQVPKTPGTFSRLTAKRRAAAGKDSERKIPP